MSITDNPNDPDLGRGPDESPVGQNKKYLVLSEEERALGFVRPYRDTYRHVGKRPQYPLADLTDEQKARFGDAYVKWEAYPEEMLPRAGRYWTKEELERPACRQTTTMGRAIAETYARDNTFYGSTYCTTCCMHRPVAEFTWVELNGAEGPVLGT